MVQLRNTRESILNIRANKVAIENARLLRKNMTSAEKILWQELKGRKLNGLKFRRQHPIHFYIADFYCHELKLIIELDGEVHNEVLVDEHDKNRTAELDRFGIKIIRFMNDQVLNSLDQTLNTIKSQISSITREVDYSPSPSGEGAGG